MTRWKIAGVNFDHMHMGDLLRQVHDHANAEIAGVCHTDRERMATTIQNFNIPPERVVEVDAVLQGPGRFLPVCM